MNQKERSPIQKVVILGDDENAAVCALLMAHKLSMLEIQVVLVVGELYSSDVQLKNFSPGIRNLHNIIELSEKDMLREGIIRYVYGAEFIRKKDTVIKEHDRAKSFFAYDNLLLPKELDVSLLVHALSSQRDLYIDDISLSARAHEAGKFVDPELIREWPFCGLRAGMLVNVKKYLKFLLEVFQQRGGRVVVAKSVSIESPSEINVLSSHSETVFSVDLIINFSPAGLTIDWGNKDTREESLPLDYVTFSKRIVSYSIEEGDRLIESSYQECTGSGHLARITFDGISQAVMFPGKSGSIPCWDDGCFVGKLSASKVDDSGLFAPYWCGNVISFPKYSIPPWDSVTSLNDWIGNYLTNIIDFWPRVSSMEASALEFNRLGAAMAADYFEMAAVYCKLNNITVNFPRDIVDRADRRIELFTSSGIVPEPESDLFQKDFWVRLMALFEGLPLHPAGIYSRNEVVHCVDQLRKLQAFNAAAVSKMPQYNEFITYLVSR